MKRKKFGIIFKISYIIIIATIFTCAILNSQAKNLNNQKAYKVIKITDGDTFYIDFNNDNFPNKEERVRVNGIDAFENKVNNGLKAQMRIFNLTEKEILTLGHLGYLYAKEELLGKEVCIKYTADKEKDKYNRPLVSIYYDCKDSNCKNYEQEILKQGLATVYTKSNLAKKLEKFENYELIYKNLANSQKFDDKTLYYFTIQQEEYKKNHANDVKKGDTQIRTGG